MRCGDGAKWIHVVCMSLYENAYKRHTITVLIITNNLLDSGLMKHQKSELELSQALKIHVRVHKTNEPPNIHKKINNYKSVSLYTLVFSSIHTTKFFNIIHQFHFFACCIQYISIIIHHIPKKTTTYKILWTTSPKWYATLLLLHVQLEKKHLII